MSELSDHHAAPTRPEDLLGPISVARELGVSENEARDLVATGKLDTREVNGKRFVTRETLDAYVKFQRTRRP